MRLKTRVVTILLFCCLLIVLMLFYFIIFLDQLEANSGKDFKIKDRLIIVPFTEIRSKNSTKNGISSQILRKIESKLKTFNFDKLFDNSDKIRAKSLVDSLKSELSVPEKVPSEPPVWQLAQSWVRARQVLPEKCPLLGHVLNQLQKSRVLRADVAKKGTQLKVRLELEGGQHVLFKPMRYSRDYIADGLYSGADRHNGEIVAFHLSRLVNLRFVPLVSSRLIDVRNEIKSVSTSALLSTFVTHPNRTIDCFYGECYYCSQFDLVCAQDNGMLEGAVILLLPSKYQLQKLRNPWQRTYKTDVKAVWEQDMDYCSAVLKKLPLRPRVLDLIDVSIFDFLIGNADRHHYEVFKDVPNSALLFIDNGKSFGDSITNSETVSILYPLYQCCSVRNSTYERLRMLSSIRISDAIEHILSEDILAPLLTRPHLDALDIRLKTIIAIIQICFDTKGKLEVLK